MQKYYILNECNQPEPIHNIMHWALWFETADRVVAGTEVNKDITVSTVFLGLDHQWSDGPPLLYETLVFGGEMDGEMERYSTKDEAITGHDAMVQRVRQCTE